MKAAREFLLRRSRADRLAHRKRDDLPKPQRRRKRKRSRALAGDGMEIDGHANAYHGKEFCPDSRTCLPRGSNDAVQMSAFGEYAPTDVVEAADKFISKMDDRDLAAAIEQSERTMSAEKRSLLVESIFDAFRRRGESSQDAAEGAGTTVDAIVRAETSAIALLLAYARSNAGLLKEATLEFIEREPAVVGQFPPTMSEGIARRLRS